MSAKEPKAVPVSVSIMLDKIHFNLMEFISEWSEDQKIAMQDSVDRAIENFDLDSEVNKRVSIILKDKVKYEMRRYDSYLQRIIKEEVVPKIENKIKKALREIDYEIRG